MSMMILIRKDIIRLSLGLGTGLAAAAATITTPTIIAVTN